MDSKDFGSLEAYIPHNGFPIIPGTHRYPWVERMNIKNICLPMEKKTDYQQREKPLLLRDMHTAECNILFSFSFLSF